MDHTERKEGEEAEEEAGEETGVTWLSLAARIPGHVEGDVNSPADSMHTLTWVSLVMTQPAKQKSGRGGSQWISIQLKIGTRLVVLSFLVIGQRTATNCKARRDVYAKDKISVTTTLKFGDTPITVTLKVLNDVPGISDDHVNQLVGVHDRGIPMTNPGAHHFMVTRPLEEGSVSAWTILIASGDNVPVEVTGVTQYNKMEADVSVSSGAEGRETVTVGTTTKAEHQPFREYKLFNTELKRASSVTQQQTLISTIGNISAVPTRTELAAARLRLANIRRVAKDRKNRNKKVVPATAVNEEKDRQVVQPAVTDVASGTRDNGPACPPDVGENALDKAATVWLSTQSRPTQQMDATIGQEEDPTTSLTGAPEQGDQQREVDTDGIEVTNRSRKRGRHVKGGPTAGTNGRKSKRKDLRLPSDPDPRPPSDPDQYHASNW